MFQTVDFEKNKSRQPVSKRQVKVIQAAEALKKCTSKGLEVLQKYKTNPVLSKRPNPRKNIPIERPPPPRIERKKSHPPQYDQDNDMPSQELDQALLKVDVDAMIALQRGENALTGPETITQITSKPNEFNAMYRYIEPNRSETIQEDSNSNAVPSTKNRYLSSANSKASNQSHSNVENGVYECRSSSNEPTHNYFQNHASNSMSQVEDNDIPEMISYQAREANISLASPGQTAATCRSKKDTYRIQNLEASILQ